MTDEDVSVYIILYSRLLSKETTGKCPVCGDRTGCLRTAAMFEATKAGFLTITKWSLCHSRSTELSQHEIR